MDTRWCLCLSTSAVPGVKLEVGLAKGKKLYDKRASAAAKDAKREMDRTMKSRRTGGY